MKKSYIILTLIFLATLLFNLLFTFQTPYFSYDEAYFHIKHIQNIREHLTPLTYDSTSYNGRIIVYPPLFHYLLAFFSFIPFYLKLIPALLISSLVIIIYLICKEITGREESSLLAALFSGFLPIIIERTLNQISVYSLFLPIMFLMFYIIMKSEKKYFTLFLICAALLSLIHQSAFIFLLALIFYLVLMNTEAMPLLKLKKKMIALAILLIILISFTIFNQAIFKYGLKVIFGNIPFQLIKNYFRELTIFESLYLVGILPIILGGIGIFYGVYKEKKESVILFSGLILSIILLLLLKLISIPLGLMFLTLGLVIVSSYTLSKLYSYFSLTKLSKHKNKLTLIFILLIFFLSILPAYDTAKTTMKIVPSADEIKSLEDIKNVNASIASLINEGHLVSAVTGMSNIVDNKFLFANDPEQRLSDLNILYKTPLRGDAMTIIRKYDIKYIYFSEKAKRYYNLEELPYTIDNSCFKKQGYVYEVLC